MLDIDITYQLCQFHKYYGLLLDAEPAMKIINYLVSKYSINTLNDYKTPSKKYFKALTEDDLKTINPNIAFAAINYGGRNPIWCLWCTTIRGKYYNFYVNFTTQQIVIAKHRFSPVLYESTLFEGEIINGQYIIWDIMVHRSKNMASVNFNSRIAIMKGLLEFHHVMDPLVDNLTLKAKMYARLKHLKDFYNKYVVMDSFAQGLWFLPYDMSVSKIYTVMWRFNVKINCDLLSGGRLNPPNIVTLALPKKEEFTSVIRQFYIHPLRNQADNYMLYTLLEDGNLIKHELGVVTSAENSKKLSFFFSEEKEENKNDNKNKMICVQEIYPLVLCKCKFVKRFQLWEPFVD